MKEIIKDIYEGILGSLDTTDKGFSSRKLTGFAIVGCVVSAHIKWLTLGNLSDLESILIIDYGFIATLFGLTTYSAIKANGTKP